MAKLILPLGEPQLKVTAKLQQFHHLTLHSAAPVVLGLALLME
jgi:hypothetical protein